MVIISAFHSEDSSLKKKPSNKRRTRGPKPRGPRPQVCDLCQIRKVKCNRALPRCSLCQKVNRPCTYDRLGFSTNSKPKSSEGQSQNPTKSKKLSPNNLTVASDNFFEFKDNNLEDCKSIIQNTHWKGNSLGICKINSMDGLFLRSIIKTSLLQFGRSQLYASSNGNFYYSGPSLATHYFASNSRLFAPVFSPVVASYSSVIYNKNIKVDITKTLILQLVELYFGYLNSFFPLIDAPSFYSQLHQGNYDEPFLALLSVVCLSGTSFYPNRTIGRIIAIIFSKRVKLHFKSIYMKPSMTSIQACLLAAYHISLCEDDSVIENSIFFLSTAKRMVEAMGLPLKPLLSKTRQHQRKIRMYWMIFCAEALVSACFGTPMLKSGNKVALPDAEFMMSSVNFTCPSVFIIREIISLKPEHNGLFFRQLCLHCKLLECKVEITATYGQSSHEQPVSMHSLESILHNKDPLPQKSIFFKKMKELEIRCIQTFQKIPKFRTNRTEKTGITLPDSLDIHYSQLSIFYFSLLVDMNRPFINPKQIVRGMPLKARSLPLDQYSTASPLERTLLATFYGCQIFIDMKRWYNEVGIPYTWYCAVQFCFMFLYMVKIFDKEHWAYAPAIRNAKFLIDLFEKNSDRWAIIRDAYFILKPFMDELKIGSESS